MYFPIVFTLTATDTTPQCLKKLIVPTIRDIPMSTPTKLWSVGHVTANLATVAAIQTKTRIVVLVVDTEAFHIPNVADYAQYVKRVRPEKPLHKRYTISLTVPS
jgi:hypothetical protein